MNCYIPFLRDPVLLAERKLVQRLFLWNTWGSSRIQLEIDFVGVIVNADMSKSILYLGDASLKTAASYLAGVMTAFDISFDYQPSDEKFDESLLDKDYKAVIISDYPGKNFTDDQLNFLAEKNFNGMGLLMIGGWESFSSVNREYTDTILKKVLPVNMHDSDDRINCFAPCVIKKTASHIIVDHLPFDVSVPLIGGYNLVTAKPAAEVILSCNRFQCRYERNRFNFVPYEKTDPLLVLGSYGRGRVAAFASDVAPHWVGGFIDWGDSRLKACAARAEAIEVGCWYAQFFANMVNWTAGKI
jgi:uncharacterized membrane protein